MLISKSFKKTINIIAFLIIFTILYTGTAAGQYIYDLCYDYYPLSKGRILFLRYRNPLLDPVLKTFELYIFDPEKSTLTFIPRYGEKIYLKPVVSPDRTTICYHSLIEGRDYLVTKNIEFGRNIRLSFDTGGYFLKLAVAFNDDTVAAAIKRGENKQAIYYISNSKGLLKRLLNGKDFLKLDFLKDGSILYIDRQNGKNILGIVNYSRENYVISEDISFASRTPEGDAVVYMENNHLKFFRVNNREKITLVDSFMPSTNDVKNSISFSSDGTALSIVSEDAIRIINIPSGDVFYYISMKLKGANHFLTNYSFYIAKDKTVFYLLYKKPGQSLLKLFDGDEKVKLLGTNPDDRYIVYKQEDPKSVYIYDKKTGKIDRRSFNFKIEGVSFLTTKNSFYIVALNRVKGIDYPVRELYLYDFKGALLYPISVSERAKLSLYKRRP